LAAFNEVSSRQLARMDAVFGKYKALDDAVFNLQTSLPRFKLFLDQYGIDLSDAMQVMIDPGVFGNLAAEAQKSFFKSMEKSIENGELNYRPLSVENLLESFVETWGAQVGRMTGTISSNLFQRAAAFKSLSAAATIPAQRITDIEKYDITSVNIGGTQYNYTQLKDIWGNLNDSYGQRDTIQYRNGVNYPVRAYVDARGNTTQAEAHRLTTIAEGSSNGILFGMVNKTGTTDSCLLHEDEIFYLTAAAREIALKRWPDIPMLKKMKTWEEIVAGPTHMGKFGCRHIVRAISIQFLSDARFREYLSQYPPKALPEKINERKIFEAETGRKWISGKSKPQKSYQPIPNRTEIQPRYTIA
jgi:hypothetical protein